MVVIIVLLTLCLVECCGYIYFITFFFNVINCRFLLIFLFKMSVKLFVSLLLRGCVNRMNHFDITLNMFFVVDSAQCQDKFDFTINVYKIILKSILGQTNCCLYGLVTHSL